MEYKKIKCTSADKYKGKREPKCNGGKPCEACKKTYELRQKEDGRRLGKESLD